MRINYNLDSLRALESLYRTHSFVRAAKMLHITQPALTRRIQLLEEAIGGRLVDRTTRTLSFTTLGKWLIDRVAAEMDALDQHMQSAARIARGEDGSIQFACLTTVAYAIAPTVVDRFHTHYPRVKVSLLDDTGQRVMESVRSGRAEFGVGLASDVLHGLQADVVCADPYVLAMASNHALAKRAQIRWKELEGARLVALRNTSGNRPQIDAELEAQGITPPWFDEVEHLSSLLGWLHAGPCAGVIPQLATRTADGRSLRWVPLVAPRIERSIALVKRQGSTLSATGQFLWDLFDKALRT